MSLKERITDEMKAAMRAKDAARLSAIRLLLAAVKQKEIDERIEADDAQVLSIVEKLIKQRRDSIEQFVKAGRNDLADREKFELEVLGAYLPEQASAGEIDAETMVINCKEGSQARVKDMPVFSTRLRRSNIDNLVN